VSSMKNVKTNKMTGMRNPEINVTKNRKSWTEEEFPKKKNHIY